MPLTVKEGAMIGAGLTLVAGATIFYRRKQTLPFKVAYFLSWPVLGSAIILSTQPSTEKMTQELQQCGLDPARVEASRQLAALQMESLRATAGQGKEPR